MACISLLKGKIKNVFTIWQAIESIDKKLSEICRSGFTIFIILYQFYLHVLILSITVLFATLS